METDIRDCLIIGAGPVGLATAAGLMRRGISCHLCGLLPWSSSGQVDLRTAALFDGSIRFLSNIGAWNELALAATPLSGIRIVDGTGSWLRAPTQTFHARDIGESTLGYNIANASLVAALRETIATTEQNDLGATVSNVTINPDVVTATLDNGTKRYARLAIAADGRRSQTRDAAGISIKQWDYQQSAITAHFDHALPNEGISTELHLSDGPCTVVPTGENRSSLVWMTSADVATKLQAQDDATFIASLEKHFNGLIGPISNITLRMTFPLSTLIADSFGKNRVALVGESSHAFPPIGAQGLNLGLRDVASLIDHVEHAISNQADPGAQTLLTAFDKDRRADVLARTYGVDILNRSLSQPVIGLLRGAAMHAAGTSNHLKKLMIERGMRPLGAWPSMMR